MIKKNILPLLLISGLIINLNADMKSTVDLTIEAAKEAAEKGKDAIVDFVVGNDLDLADYKNKMQELQKMAKDTQIAIDNSKSDDEKSKLTKRFFEKKLELYNEMAKTLNKANQNISKLSGDLISRVEALESASKEFGKAEQAVKEVEDTKTNGKEIVRELKATLKRLELAKGDFSKEMKLEDQKYELVEKLQDLAVELKHKKKMANLYSMQKEWSKQISGGLKHYTRYARSVAHKFRLQEKTLKGDQNYIKALLNSGTIGISSTMEDIQKYGEKITEITGIIDETEKTGDDLITTIFAGGIPEEPDGPVGPDADSIEDLMKIFED